MQIGTAIKHFRKEQKMSQSVLGVQADISQVALSQIENGQTNPNFPTLKNIAQALNVSVAAIYVMSIGVDDIWSQDPDDKEVQISLEAGKQLLLKAL